MFQKVHVFQTPVLLQTSKRLSLLYWRVSSWVSFIREFSRCRGRPKVLVMGKNLDSVTKPVMVTRVTSLDYRHHENISKVRQPCPLLTNKQTKSPYISACKCASYVPFSDFDQSHINRRVCTSTSRSVFVPTYWPISPAMNSNFLQIRIVYIVSLQLSRRYSTPKLFFALVYLKLIVFVRTWSMQ